MKKLQRQGESFILPIVGDIVSEIVLSTCRMPSIIFQDSAGDESEIAFAETITLSRGDNEFVLTGANPGVTFNPKELSPLVDLLGSQVTEAVASRDGSLWITVSSRYSLRVVPDSYEAWHFLYPRAGRPIGGNVKNYVSFTGGK